MKSIFCGIFVITILTSLTSNAQRLKKADRQILSNIESHVTQLNNVRNAGGSSADHLSKAADYVSRQFQKSGLRPAGDSGTWFQKFNIYAGKEIQPSTNLVMNGHKLQLYSEFFPFAFSASKAAAGSVVIALAEDGYPWFKDMRDMHDDEDAKDSTLAGRIRDKARQAAAKGATALILYSSTGEEPRFDSIDRSKPVDIPVIYLTRAAFKKYCADESQAIDLNLNVDLQEKVLSGVNVVGTTGNENDSTTVISASLDNLAASAAVIETARVAKNTRGKKTNAIFAVCSNGDGAEYFNSHSARPVSANSITFASGDSTISNEVQLQNVKETVESIKL